MQQHCIQIDPPFHSLLDLASTSSGSARSYQVACSDIDSGICPLGCEGVAVNTLLDCVLQITCTPIIDRPILAVG